MTAGLRRLVEQATAGPAYPPDEADLRDAAVAGLALPLRASVALFLATALVLADYTGIFRAAGADAQAIAVQRLVLFGLVPLVVVLVVFRDQPTRYGLGVGDWRWGVSLLAGGLVVMTPIILWLATRPDFAAYYGPGTAFSRPIAYNAIELFAAEFLLRGFLLFALLRRIGPFALVVVQVPFVFSHIGKPELELWSTFVGGSVFAWLNWRTGSILWSALGHLFVLTLMVVAVGGTV